MARKPKLAERLYERLLRPIQSGEWPEGTKIPTETRLAEDYGVSRPVIREALVRLRTAGILGSKQGYGNYVIATKSTRRSGYKAVENVADLISTFELRLSVECDTAASAAIKRNADDIRAIEEAVAKFQNPSADDDFGDLDFDFHVAIAEASKNPMYVNTLDMLRDQIVFGMRIVGEFAGGGAHNRIDLLIKEHEEILRQIKAAAPKAAWNSMNAHLVKSCRRLLGFDISIGRQSGRAEPPVDRDNPAGGWPA